MGAILDIGVLLVTGLAMAVALAFVNRSEYAVFTTVYFLTQVPLMLAVLGLYRWASEKHFRAFAGWRIGPNRLRDA